MAVARVSFVAWGPWLRAALVVASVGAPAGFARADDHEVCSKSALDPDAGVPACTRLLEAGGAPEKAPSFLNNRGVGKVRAGDLTGAVEDFTRALDRSPRFGDALKNRGISFQLLGEFDRAIADFTRALQLDRRSVSVLNARGSALFSKQEFDRAITDFDAAIAIDPSYAKAVINRGLAYLHKRDLDRALTDFDAFLKLRPEDPIGFENRAALFMDKGDLPAAIRDYDAAIHLAPKNAGAFSRRGEAWRLSGDLDKSLRDHDVAIDLGAGVEGFNNRALTLRDLGRLDRALADLNEAILLSPKSFLSYANRGDLRRRKGDTAGAVADLDKAVELNSRSPVALTFRGELRLARGNPESAIGDFNEAIRVVPDFVAAYAGRGQAFERQGNVKAARADLEKALALSPHADAALARPAQDVARLRLAAIAEAEAERARIAAAAAAAAASAAEAKRAADQAAKLAALESVRSIKEARVRGESERAEAEAKARAEFESRLREEVNARARREIDERVKAEVAEKTRAAEALARSAATAAAKTRAAEETRAAADTEARIRAEIEAKAKAEFDSRLKAEVARLAEEAGKVRESLPEPPKGPRVALVIGNAKYVNTAALANPANDAADVSAALRGLGFEVIEGLNLDKRGMEQQLARFARLARTADAALVYYAGHGLQYQGQNFLVPTDAKLEDEISLQFEMLRLDDVTSVLSLAGPARILILDACRNNPLADRMAGRNNARSLIGQGLAKMASVPGLVTVYATSANKVAFDGTGRNSIFTTALLAGLAQPNLEITQVFRRVAAAVQERTGGRQSPELSLSLANEFFFNIGDRTRRSGDEQKLVSGEKEIAGPDAERGVRPPRNRGTKTP